MFRFPLLLRSFLPFLLACALTPSLSAQEPSTSVPSAPNATCPIMGKKVSAPLFVDTPSGRIWLCCKPCIKKVLADVPTAHKTAYPVITEHANTVCPVTGTAIGAHAERLTLQGHSFQVCCSECAAKARTDSQPTLAKLLDTKLQEVGNTTCPIRGTAVASNAFVVIGEHIVRLADAKAADEAAKAPAATLAKAQALAKAQPPQPKHEPKAAPKQEPAKPAETPKEAK